jgi:hypothetical protein
MQLPVKYAKLWNYLIPRNDISNHRRVLLVQFYAWLESDTNIGHKIY